ncbi:TIM-barrel domain-containing protein [Kitasatospora azatica]|uniref:TIM-barrel domain-containing protein n=1 Tax=Kitasatospora azatica TaxID=58347 RepID=UPI0007C7111C|nr:TIM-barrel domain-containing protein [Kitasatospora azatica]
MPYRQPLAPWITHVADPRDLPLLAPGDEGPSRVLSAEPVSHDREGLRLRALMSTGDHLLIDVRAAGEGVIRVRLAPTAETVTRSAAATRLVTPGHHAGARVEIGADGAWLQAGAVSATIDFDPWRIRFHDATGTLLTEQNTDESDISLKLRVLPFGRSLGPDGGVLAYHETFAARPDEHFVGLGEKFTGLDKRGQRIVTWNYDAFSSESERSYKNVPLYLSSRGYGVLVDSGMATEFDICHSTHSCVQITVPDDQLDYYLIAGPTPAETLDRYHRLTGRPVTPPRWALGAWISTGYLKVDQEGTLAQARRIREHGIPCDVLHLDAYWQRSDRWSDLRWDEDRFPEPAGMLSALHDLGFKVCVWMNPYVSVESPLFEEGAGKGYFLKRADGSVHVADVWHGSRPECGITDFTNPEATAWFQGLLRPLLEQGVDVFKTDFGEGVPVDASASNGMTGEELHNVYSLLFNDAVADVTEQVAGHRVVWARSSFTGGQRHCGQWAGDNNTSFAAMASTLRGGLSYAFSGVPYWSHDVGGFTGTPAPDLMARSAQFGAFSPMLRFHGTSTRYPWDFEHAVDRAVVDAVRLRYRLMPYLYSAAVESGTSGATIMRPLAMHAPQEPGTWSADLEYLFGPDLLVAPITSPEGERHLYLPDGQWIDYWTGEFHTGGRHLRVAKPLDQVPLFVRNGALIPTTTPRATVGDGDSADITVVCWTTGDGHAVVHDENGTTRLELVRTGPSVELTSTGPLPVRAVFFPPLVGGPHTTSVRINGRAAQPDTEGAWHTDIGGDTA